MSDPFDLGSQPQPGEQAAVDARIDRAIELASYLLAHPYPAPGVPAQGIRYRIENLSGCQSSEAELDLLIAETEYWMEQLARDPRP